MIRPLIVVTIGLAISTVAGAAYARGFANTENEWERLPPGDKAAYIQGLNDSANFIFVNDDLPTAIVKIARTRCLIEHKTTANDLATAITTTYVNNSKAFANAPPIAVYVAYMGAVCKPIINQERARLELPPIQ